MEGDIFGNLRDWGRVLSLVEDIKKSKTLDTYQQGLVRILRYRDNWRLREIVLEYIKDLNNPSDELMLELITIMMDENIYYDARILAADAISELIPKCKENQEQKVTISRAIIIEKMKALLDSPQPPMFHEAINKTLEVIRNKQA